MLKSNARPRTKNVRLQDIPQILRPLPVILRKSQTLDAESIAAREIFTDSQRIEKHRALQPETIRSSDGIRRKTSKSAPIADLIEAKLLPPGFVLPPSVRIQSGQHGTEFLRNRQAVDREWALLANARRIYAGLHAKLPQSDAIRADHAEEIRLGVQTADPRPRARL